MKITTQKKMKKLMKFYITNFGFRKPYQVLMDGTILQTALAAGIQLEDQLSIYLEREAKILTTQCVILEIEKLGFCLRKASSIMKQYAHHKCGHEGRPVSASACLRSMLGKKNENRYILATQDKELTRAARKVPGTPIVYVNGHTPVFEDPSQASLGAAHAAGQAKFVPTPLPRAAEPPRQRAEPKEKKPKKKLPFKKKKRNAPMPVRKPSNEGNEVKRKRKRVKLAKHLKEIKREWLGQDSGQNSKA